MPTAPATSTGSNSKPMHAATSRSSRSSGSSSDRRACDQFEDRRRDRDLGDDARGRPRPVGLPRQELPLAQAAEDLEDEERVPVRLRARSGTRVPRRGAPSAERLDEQPGEVLEARAARARGGSRRDGRAGRSTSRPSPGRVVPTRRTRWPGTAAPGRRTAPAPPRARSGGRRSGRPSALGGEAVRRVDEAPSGATSFVSGSRAVRRRPAPEQRRERRDEERRLGEVARERLLEALHAELLRGTRARTRRTRSPRRPAGRTRRGSSGPPPRAGGGRRTRPRAALLPIPASPSTGRPARRPAFASRRARAASRSRPRARRARSRGGSRIRRSGRLVSARIAFARACHQADASPSSSTRSEFDGGSEPVGRPFARRVWTTSS